jgi:hypothetical protein
MVESRPRARAVLIWILVGLAVIAVYFVFIASNEADNNASDSGGVVATSVFDSPSLTPASTAFEAVTPAP